MSGVSSRKSLELANRQGLQVRSNLPLQKKDELRTFAVLHEALLHSQRCIDQNSKDGLDFS